MKTIVNAAGRPRDRPKSSHLSTYLSFTERSTSKLSKVFGYRCGVMPPLFVSPLPPPPLGAPLPVEPESSQGSGGEFDRSRSCREVVGNEAVWARATKVSGSR